MSTTTRHMKCLPADVFAVLADGWLTALWVVGAARMRDVDATWPSVGSRLHHSVGTWPFLLDDTTSVVEWDPETRVRLQARAWPAGEASVVIDVGPAQGGCTVTIIEDATKGAGTLIPRAVRSVLLDWRNREALRRLDFLATNRIAAGRLSLSDPPS